MAKKTAVVTGSNSGIGLGSAHALAAAGYNVVINSFTDRPEDHNLAKEIAAKHGTGCAYIKADMSKGDECRALIDQAAATFGSVDVLVNNAGIQFVAPVDEFPTEKWDAIIAINLTSAFHTTAAALPYMKKPDGAASSISPPPMACAHRRLNPPMLPPSTAFSV